MTSYSDDSEQTDGFWLEVNLEFALASSMAEFDRAFPTKEDCLEEIYRIVAMVSIVKCHHCESVDMDKTVGQRTAVCRSCKKTSWLTANTFFHHVRSPRAWLAAIWLMEHGFSISSSRFHKLVGIAYSTALNIFKKLTVVLHEQMDEDSIAMDTALFLSAIGKRSRETPARLDPSAEQEAVDEQKSPEQGANDHATSSTEEVTEATIGTDRLSEVKKQVYRLLSEKPIHSDLLGQQTGVPIGEISAALVMLEMDALVRRLPGDHYVRLIPHRLSSITAIACTTNSINPTIIAKGVTEFVCSQFHRISRKYLQNYIAAYWCHKDRTRWSLGAIMEACCKFRHVSYDEILAYVSPPLVKVMLSS